MPDYNALIEFYSVIRVEAENKAEAHVAAKKWAENRAKEDGQVVTDITVQRVEDE